jgi:hypothetical protein
MIAARTAAQLKQEREPNDRIGIQAPKPIPAKPSSPPPSKTEKVNHEQRARISAPVTPISSRIGSLLFASLMIFLIYAGWHDRAESYLTAESGAGYALGIIGASLMLLLLLYPLRKRINFMRHFGPVKYWFRSHMMLGIIGPICILYHANFKLGAINSNIALFCMITVASSGLIGRYLYRNIHYGLYGRKATLKELLDDEAMSKGRAATTLEFVPEIKSRLQTIQAWEPRMDRGVFYGVVRISLFGLWSHWSHFRLQLQVDRALAAQGRANGWTSRQARQQRRMVRLYLSNFFTAVRRVAQFSLFERLFSLWHLLHMPLFITMLITGVIHVIAVHMY